MTQRLVDIDDALLEQARQALGTATITDTVTTALRQAISSSERRTRLDEESLRRFADAAVDLGDDEVLASAWR
jgi:Arc/MetJ family transcription regulator